MSNVCSYNDMMYRIADIVCMFNKSKDANKSVTVMTGSKMGRRNDVFYQLINVEFLDPSIKIDETALLIKDTKTGSFVSIGAKEITNVVIEEKTSASFSVRTIHLETFWTQYKITFAFI